MSAQHKNPSLEPQRINPHAWFYEGDKTLEFFVDAMDFDNGTIYRTVSFRVPIKKLLKSIRRCYKTPKRRATN